jgi:hypothetical protein
MVRGHVTTMGKGATKLVDYDPELTCLDFIRLTDLTDWDQGDVSGGQRITCLSRDDIRNWGL